MSFVSFANHLLVAMPSLTDAYFRRSVVYVCEHNPEGAMGIVINIPINMSLAQLLEQAVPEATVLPEKAEQIVVKGGPVSPERGFILHSPQACWDSSLGLSADFMVTTSKDILSALGNDAGPDKQIIALGYAGWSDGQLEQELQDNAWLTIPASAELVFDTPLHLRWESAVKALGIEPWQLTQSAGHA
jgi:putative transcriptional regulator